MNIKRGCILPQNRFPAIILAGSFSGTTKVFTLVHVRSHLFSYLPGSPIGEG
ncbi:hypothetical protein PDN71_13025 [Bacillus cereus]|nr:hypothetical protein [Bacillus cereus]